MYVTYVHILNTEYHGQCHDFLPDDTQHNHTRHNDTWQTVALSNLSTAVCRSWCNVLLNADLQNVVAPHPCSVLFSVEMPNLNLTKN